MRRLTLAAAAAGLLASVALASSATAQTQQAYFVEDDGVSVGVVQLNNCSNVQGCPVTFNTGALPSAIVGLGELGVTLYGESATGTLYNVIIPLDGTAPSEISIGSTTLASGVTFIDFGSTDSTLYAISSNGYLYDINASTGATVGSPVELMLGGNPLGDLTRTFAVNGGGLSTYMSLSTGSSTLYFTMNDGGTAGGGTEDLYTINTTTGALTLVGTAGTGNSALTIGGMSFQGGLLYGGCNRGGGPSACYNGSQNGVFSFSGTPPSLTAGTVSRLSSNPSKPIFLGLAAVPEPSTWALMLMGLGAVGGALRFRRKRSLAAA